MSADDRPYNRDHLAVFQRSLVKRVGVSIGEYKGHKFLDIRNETSSDGETWWPTKDGATLRPHELREAAAALLRAADELGVA